MAIETERRRIALPLSPPRRLLADNAYRVFKTRDDRHVWAAAWAPVAALLADGWAVERVAIDWGRRRPYGHAFELALARLFPGMLVEQTHTPDDARGHTLVYLVRE